MNRWAGIFLVMLLIAVAFAVTLGYAFETKVPVTTTSVKTVTLTTSNKAQLVTVTEEIIGVITPQTVTLTFEVEDSNCTILEPTLVILGYNTTEFILPNDNLNSSTFSIVSTVTSFSQMPTPQATTYTTTTVTGNVESAYTTITTDNSTIVSSTFTCPTMLP